MGKAIDDFSVAGELWENTQEIEEIRKRVEHVRLWFEADDTPDPELMVRIGAVQDSLDALKRDMIDAQIKLLTIL